MKKNLLLKTVSMIVLLLLSLAPAQESFAQSGNQEKKEKLNQKFRKAVKDAEIAEPSEISKNLTPIAKFNTKLKWKPPENNEVLVVTWIDDQLYTNVYKDKKEITTSREIEMWVTAAPELEDRCKKFKRKNLTLRLEQLLGLKPDAGKTMFIEIWVDPKYLFRPSADPEIVDQEAVLEFPFSLYLMISEAHIKWFNDLKATSYGPDGYPWTRLGYTYDWKYEPKELKKKIGLSEFKVRVPLGTTLSIERAESTEKYCKKK